MKSQYAPQAITIGAALGFASCSLGQAAVADDVAETIASNTHVLELGQDGIAGPGGELLRREARAASVLCVGESHLNNETPLLVSTMLPALRDMGYSAFAIETGERITQQIQRAFENDAGDEILSLFKEKPFTSVFVDHKPDFELAQRAVELGYELWGLDQAFFGAARYNLDELTRLSRTDAQREIAEEQLERADDAFQHFMATGDASKAFLTSTGPETYDALRDAFAGHAEAKRIIDELEASGRVYRLYGEGRNYQSNHERISLMKRHLAERVGELEASEKILMKFGSMHMGRGYSPLNQLDLGNAAAELGALRGGGSLNVYVMAAGSRTGSETRDFRDTSPMLQALTAGMGDANWIVVDLRSLRPIFHAKKKREGFEELSEHVWRYDLAILTKEFTQAERLPGTPDPPVK